MKLYHAIVWQAAPEIPGERVSVWATDIAQAKELLEAKHGCGNVFNLHNKEQSEAPRG
jgi:hypothetical protein